jgi:hypothetical protein
VNSKAACEFILSLLVALEVVYAHLLRCARRLKNSMLL